MLNVTLKIDKTLENKAYVIQRTLVMKVLPRALDRAAVIAADAMRPELPDGVESGSRARQSAKSRARYPTHMKDHVRRKLVSDETGVLKIVGVSGKAQHVNFDHGDKAKSVGRLHILWGNGPLPAEYGGPMRKQIDDIPKIVEQKIEARVRQIVADTIRAAVQSGELA